MYGCRGYIDECISVSCREIKTPINIECRNFDSIDVDCSHLDEKIKVVCSIVCSINNIAFLRVQPDYVWLTPEMLSGEFDIISNVSWVID